MSLNYNNNIDSVTGQNIRIDYPHHEIHGGSGFFFTRALTVDDTNSDEVLIVTPSGKKQAHILLFVESTGQTDFKLYEVTTRAGGTPIVPINRNRNSASASILTVTHTPSGGAVGNLIAESFFGVDTGAGNNRQLSGGGSSSRQEIILKSDEKYLIVVDSGTNGNRITIVVDWYEHTDKS